MKRAKPEVVMAMREKEEVHTEYTQSRDQTSKTTVLGPYWPMHKWMQSIDSCP